ncbi:MAG: hypothetical protein Q9216_001116 [Gyalolechia sp. 2 TL-2023]
MAADSKKTTQITHICFFPHKLLKTDPTSRPSAMSAALVPLTIAPFAAGTLNPITDALLCAGIIIHSHIGFQSVIIDYVPDKRLPKTRALFWWGLRLATLVVAVGFFEFETNDVGLTEAVKKIWTAKRPETASVEPILRGVA